jgi:hypothetical protein
MLPLSTHLFSHWSMPLSKRRAMPTSTHQMMKMPKATLCGLSMRMGRASSSVSSGRTGESFSTVVSRFTCTKSIVLNNPKAQVSACFDLWYTPEVSKVTAGLVSFGSFLHRLYPISTVVSRFTCPKIHSFDRILITGCRFLPPLPLSVAKTCKNCLNEEITPLLPTGKGERFSQTISNLGHVQRSCTDVNSPYK